MNCSNAGLSVLQDEVVACRKCPRLVRYLSEVATVKRRAYRDWDYWARPVPGFGDPAAGLLILGLAPGAHGSNRTGRPFTGDKSGEILYRVMHKTGFASQPLSTSRDDGLRLDNAFITAAVRCAPPDNKPAVDEIRRCRSFLERELELLPDVRVVVALGKIAFDVYLSILWDRGVIQSRTPFRFGHGLEYVPAAGEPRLIASYHPSQQNTSTGKLTEPMLVDIFKRAARLLRNRKSDV